MPSPQSLIPQLATPIDLAHIGPYILDNGWVMEQKLDGHRILLVATETGLVPISRNGSRYTKAFPRVSLPLPPGIALDCELVGDTLWAFDIINGGGLLKTPLSDRRKILTSVDLTPVQIVPQATTPSQKQWLLLEAARTGLEGVILKRADSPYRQGQRPGTWLKMKFTKTVDCVVLSTRSDGKESATLGAFHDGTLVEIGRCSLIGKPPVVPGQVVEVKYLYAVHPEAPRLTQPTLLRVRTDKAPQECLTDQLHFTSKTVIPALA